MERNFEVLMMAQGCHDGMGRFRRERLRNKRYNYGDQWSDGITVDGRRMSEAEHISENGSEPLKNNLIRRLVRNVIGVYSAQSNAPKCTVRDPREKVLGETMTTLLKYNGELNRLSALYARTLEEFLVSGLAIHRKWYGKRGGRTDCWTEMVAADNFFVDRGMQDVRGWDCGLIGEIHDVSIDDVCMQFGRTAEDCDALREIYKQASSREGISQAWEDFGYDRSCSMDFLSAGRPGMCRVIEAWRRETEGYYLCHDEKLGAAYRVSREEHAQLDKDGVTSRWVMEEKWRYYFLSPLGHVLACGDTPYSHGGHPYAMKAYPMIDGEIHSFVGDVIDQQRYTNRLVTLYDWMLRASAKGVLLLPEDCIPEGGSAQEMVDAWSRHNGVMVYASSLRGDTPRQAQGSVDAAGVTKLLETQLKFFEDISGVNGALQGNLANSAMSAELYGQQTHQASMALLDVLNTFGEFVRDAAYLDVRNMQQFYDREKVESITGARGVDFPYDAERVRNVEFDLSISSGIATLATRQSNNALLMEIWRSGQITLEEMLRAGDFPFADALKRG
ncbi:MAG: hypothetical protein NC548_56230 [Lachnospiraceae bacterium]|nr:hypothetical protein [Lachnospiraceae bacterium]